MDANDLLELLKQGEGSTLEFKESLPKNATEIAQVLASFSNSDGGTLLVGVTDDGETCGVSNPDEIQQRLVSISQGICRPPLIAPRMGFVKLGGDKSVVWMTIAPLQYGLCFVEGRCYIRVGPVSVPITTTDQLQEALKSRSFATSPPKTISRERIIGLRPSDPDLGFRDREEKLVELRRLLEQQRSIKLVVIVGPGGIGKTELLSKVCVEVERGELRLSDAADALGADGLLYYSCRGSDRPSVGRLFSDFGRVLGSPSSEELMECWQDGSRSLTDKMRFLLGKLRAGCYLLVLDNLENLLGPDDRFESADLKTFFAITLTTAHSLRVLATARLRPAFGDAEVRAVRRVTLDCGLPEPEAVAYLRDLDSSGDLGIRDAPEELLAGAARRCYGIPRALEAMVGILLSTPTLAIASLLKNDSLFEKRVVESLAIDHYRRLTEDEKRVVEALAVLNRPVGSVAICYVLAAFYPNVPVLECLCNLARTYLVSYRRDVDLYSLHPIDQQHVYGRIPDEGSAYNKKALHRRAAHYYLEVLCRPPSQCNGVSDLDPQLSAFLHLQTAGDSDEACQVLDSIEPLPLSVWGHYQLIAEMRESIKNLQSNIRLRASNLGSLGRAYANLGETHRAIACFTQSIELAQSTGDDLQVALRVGNLGESYFVLGDTEKALMHFHRAASAFESLGEEIETGFWFGHIGLAHVRLGHFDEAAQCFQKAAGIAKNRGDKREGSWLSNLGALFLAKGETEVALSYYERSIEMARAIQDRRGLVARLRGVGSCLLRLSCADEALAKYTEALDIARSIKSRYGEAAVLHSLGRLYRHVGKLEESGACFSNALSINSPSTGYSSAINLGIVCVIQGKPLEGKTHFEKAIALCSERLAKTPNDYDAIYCLALGKVGLGEFVTARMEFYRGFAISSARGVLQDVLGDLNLLRPAVENTEALDTLVQEFNCHIGRTPTVLRGAAKGAGLPDQM